MVRQIWFGNDVHQQWIPCPRTGATKTKQHRISQLAFYNGGAWVDRSTSGATYYSFEFPVADSSEYEGIEALQRFMDGDYGDSFKRFTDPMVSDQNLFTSNWAAPGLVEQGWKEIYDGAATFSDTPSSGVTSYKYPRRSATYSVTASAGAVPSGQNSKFTILVPPTGRLYLGWIGSRTGTAVMRVECYTAAGTLGTTFDVTPTAATSSPDFFNTYVDGASYSRAVIYFTRDTSTTSTFTVAALYAQISYTGSEPVLSQHRPGKGHCGLEFTGDWVESYVMTDRHLVGGSIDLIEVESWQ